jgi:hypothetical protein
MVYQCHCHGLYIQSSVSELGLQHPSDFHVGYMVDKIRVRLFFTANTLMCPCAIMLHTHLLAVHGTVCTVEATVPKDCPITFLLLKYKSILRYQRKVVMQFVLCVWMQA